MKKIFFIFIVSVFLFPVFATAKVGVGVGTGKIVINEPLKPGTIYNAPLLAVYNTGDEKGSYIINVAYHTDQPQQRPPLNWFLFAPEKFSLEPGKSQAVAIKMNIPLKAPPGDYFAYLEAKPASVNDKGNVSIGIAAAAKIYFTVSPANFFQAVIFRITSFWKIYSPWTWIFLWIAIGAALIVLFRKNFKFQFGIAKK